MTGRWQCHHNDASSRLLRCHAPRATGLREGMGDSDQQDDIALVARHHKSEIDAAYAAYDDFPIEDSDEWGNPAAFRAAAAAS